MGEKKKCECPGCGYNLNIKTEKCPYCGTYNPEYVETHKKKSGIEKIIDIIPENSTGIARHFRKLWEKIVVFVAAIGVIIGLLLYVIFEVFITLESEIDFALIFSIFS